MFRVALFIIALNRKQPKVPQLVEWINSVRWNTTQQYQGPNSSVNLRRIQPRENRQTPKVDYIFATFCKEGHLTQKRIGDHRGQGERVGTRDSGRGRNRCIVRLCW